MPKAEGIPALQESLLAECYADMRRVARRLIEGDALRAEFTPTDLANEAAIRLIRSQSVNANDRGHMLAIAAQTMRRVLIDEARRAAADKRLAPATVTAMPGAPTRVGLDSLDDALAALRRFSEDHAQIVELRFSLGMSVQETSEATGIPERTVKRRWQAACAWLKDYLVSHGHLTRS